MIPVTLDNNQVRCNYSRVVETESFRSLLGFRLVIMQKRTIGNEKEVSSEVGRHRIALVDQSDSARPTHSGRKGNVLLYLMDLRSTFLDRALCLPFGSRYALVIQPVGHSRNLMDAAC